MSGRLDAVFIRRSGRAQDDQGQKDNVERMLKDLGVYVPEAQWFTGTVSRRKVKSNAEFNRLLEMVEASQLRTVYIESQDRWGTGDRVELFTLLGLLRQHQTQLYDLRARRDLTEKDFATELMVILASFKSQQELEDIAQRSLRSKLSRFYDGSWPSGSQPYGFGKRCLAPSGQILWEWHPTTRHLGQVFYPDAQGQLQPGPCGIRIPRKEKGQRQKTILIPSRDRHQVESAQLLFDLYTRVGLSRRQIAARLYAEGRLHYDRPFTHFVVGDILANPAYIGHTRYGEKRCGDLFTFDDKGMVVKSQPGQAAAGLLKENTHEPLITTKTWEDAQRKLADETERTSYSPRKADHYLKQLLVCGHCGKSMTARTETDRATGRKTAVYLCSSYVQAGASGYKSKCGYQRITHADAERLFQEKMAELNLPLEETISTAARRNLQERLNRLGHADDTAQQHWRTWLDEGVDALQDYFTEVYPDLGEYPACKKIRRLASQFLLGQLDDDEDHRPLYGMSVSLVDLRQAIQEAETTAVAYASGKLAELRAEHAQLTRAWAKASDAMQNVLKQDIERLERESRLWEERTVPLSERFQALVHAEQERQSERETLLAEWPALENRERGEALRRLFKSVTLFWDKEWHSAAVNPSRPRKTQRPGRWSYMLRPGDIKWDFAQTHLVGTCSPGTCNRSGR